MVLLEVAFNRKVLKQTLCLSLMEINTISHSIFEITFLDAFIGGKEDLKPNSKQLGNVPLTSLGSVQSQLYKYPHLVHIWWKQRKSIPFVI